MQPTCSFSCSLQPDTLSLSHLKPLRYIPSYFFYINFNIQLPSMPSSTNWCVPLRLEASPSERLCTFLCLPYAPIHRPFYPSWFVYPNNISWFQTIDVFWMLHSCMWVIPRRLNIICRRFGTLCLFHIHKRGKGKAVPLQAWSGSEDSRKLRFLDFMKTAQDSGKFVTLTHRPPLPPENAPGTHFC